MALNKWSSNVHLQVKDMPPIHVIEDQTRQYYLEKTGKDDINRAMVAAHIRHRYTNYNRLVAPLSSKENCGIAYITIKARLRQQIEEIVDRKYREDR